MKKERELVRLRVVGRGYRINESCCLNAEEPTGMGRIHSIWNRTIMGGTEGRRKVYEGRDRA